MAVENQETFTLLKGYIHTYEVLSEFYLTEAVTS
jgi:hypothetical protein